MSAKTAKKKAAPSKALELVTENGATAAELAAGVKIAEQLKEVSASWKDYKATEDNARVKFWTFVDNLRKPQVLAGPAGPLPAHRLNEREVTLLMLGLGEVKQRATEYKTLVTMDDTAYAAARKLSLSKIDTLRLARGTIEVVEEKGELVVKDPKKEPVDRVTPNATPEYHKVPAKFKELFHELLVGDKGVKPTDDDIPYEFNGMTADGREYMFRLFVDSVPVSEKK